MHGETASNSYFMNILTKSMILPLVSFGHYPSYSALPIQPLYRGLNPGLLTCSASIPPLPPNYIPNPFNVLSVETRSC